MPSAVAAQSSQALFLVELHLPDGAYVYAGRDVVLPALEVLDPDDPFVQLFGVPWGGGGVGGWGSGGWE